MGNVPNRTSASPASQPPPDIHWPRSVQVGEVGIRPRRRDDIPTAVWERPDMRALLAAHDIAGVYRLLNSHGVSQRAIAARTGQSQSEVSEIIAGQRHVYAYNVLVRIADGLAIPRGWMGLAFDQSTQPYAATEVHS